ncbi:MAG TPA: hypothetical protein VES42_06245 [Pilimelia sp.]|nr:hypothetical protein [Pilimelia sp.]
MTLPRPPRWFIADDILAGRISLDGYPFRYIYVSINAGELAEDHGNGRVRDVQQGRLAPNGIDGLWAQG